MRLSLGEFWRLQVLRQCHQRNFPPSGFRWQWLGFSKASPSIFALIFLYGCTLVTPEANSVNLCPRDKPLKIGIDQELIDRDKRASTQLYDLNKFHILLSKSTGCQVDLRQITDPQLGRRDLAEGVWDFAFLAPSLTVLSLSQSAVYVPLRSLGQDAKTRSSILVRKDSEINSYAGLHGKRIGLLSGGSLIGYYLPRYNSHGVQFLSMQFGHSFEDLIDKLTAGQVDAIAWDSQITPLPAGMRIGAMDPHLLPLGALVMHSRLNSLNYLDFLSNLDGNIFQLPSFLRYSTRANPAHSSYYHFKKIIRDVDKWDVNAKSSPFTNSSS